MIGEKYMRRVEPGRYPLTVQNSSIRNTLVWKRCEKKGVPPFGFQMDENGIIHRVSDDTDHSKNHDFRTNRDQNFMT